MRLTSPAASRVIAALLVVLTFTATAVAGATEHLPALGLRLLTVALVLLLWPRRAVEVRLLELAAPLVALLVILLGLALAPNRGQALQPVISVTLVVALYVAVLASVRDFAPAILVAAALVGALHAMWAVAELLHGQTSRGSGGFFNPNDLAALLAPLVVLALDRALGAASRRERRGAAALVAVLAAGVVASGSRGAALAMAAGSGLALWPHLWRRRRATLVVMALGVAALAATGQRWLTSTDPYAYTRLSIWQSSLELALANPLGVGLGAFGDGMRIHGVPVDGPVRFPRVATNAHNEILNAWVELGIPGLVATLLPPLMVAAAIARSRRRNEEEGGSQLDGTSTPSLDGTSPRPDDRSTALDEAATLTAATTRRGERSAAATIDPATARPGEGSQAETGRVPLDAAGTFSAVTHAGTFVAFAIPALVGASLHVPPVALVAAVWAAHVVRNARSPGHGSTPHRCAGGSAARVCLPAWSRRLAAALLAGVVALAVPGAASSGAVRLTLAHRQAGRMQEAGQSAAWAERLAPWSLRASMLAASLRYLNGTPPLTTTEELLDIAERFPTAPEPLYRAVELLEARAGTDPAAWQTIATLRSALEERAPLDAVAQAKLGEAELMAGRATAARDAWRAALEIEPLCAHALGRLALLAQAEGRLDEARALASRAWQAHAQAARPEEYVRQVLTLSDTLTEELARASLGPP